MTFSFLSSEEFDEEAHQFYDAGEYDRALEVLQEGLRRFPDGVDLHVGIGYVRLAREEFAWAKQSFEEALVLDAEHEDAWVGRGEALLKFGRLEEALQCFNHVDELGLVDDLELGLGIGRALYREGMFRESQDRLTRLVAANPESAEAHAALGYTLHALGDDLGARRTLRRALRLDGELHEVRIYLSHLLFERGDAEGALAELEHVPAAEHWDPLSVLRYIELKCTLGGCADDDPALLPWRERWAELQSEPDSVDHLLAEVEMSFEEGAVELPIVGESATHSVRTADGRVFKGTWEQIVIGMRDSLSDPTEPVSSFMHRAAQRIRTLTGRDLPCDDPEAFLRESARVGFLQIED